MISGSTKKVGSSVLPVNRSIPLSVNSILLFFSSITKYNSSVASCIWRMFSDMKYSSVFNIWAFTPCSLKNLINALLRGYPLKERYRRIEPSSTTFWSSLAIFFLASINSLEQRSFCAFTTTSTFGRNCSNNCSSPRGIGPEMISGVRASSINTESTSSTME